MDTITITRDDFRIAFLEAINNMMNDKHFSNGSQMMMTLVGTAIGIETEKAIFGDSKEDE